MIYVARVFLSHLLLVGARFVILPTLSTLSLEVHVDAQLAALKDSGTIDIGLY